MRISWTAKVLNEFLTRKSSRYVWKASFNMIQKNEQLPDRPSEMTEMGYVNLLYGRYCMVRRPVANNLAILSNRCWQNCASSRSPISIWRALVKLCRPCIEELYFLRSSFPL